ncbi:MAG: YlxR family protein [Clostridia bacterium]|nr:YlxR family protein [Clostridia bacterium]
MQTKKKIPMRMCIGCGEHKPKRELVRVVKNKEGNISLDLTGKAQGRGAYVCKSVDCLKVIKEKRKLNRAFSQEIPVEIYDLLIEELDNAE